MDKLLFINIILTFLVFVFNLPLQGQWGKRYEHAGFVSLKDPSDNEIFLLFLPDEETNHVTDDERRHTDFGNSGLLMAY